MLQNEQILAAGPIGDWYPSEDSMTGVIEWYRKGDSSQIVCATPHWMSEGHVPFALVYEGNDYTDLGELYLDESQPIEYQLNQYLSVLSTILSKIK